MRTNIRSAKQTSEQSNEVLHYVRSMQSNSIPSSNIFLVFPFSFENFILKVMAFYKHQQQKETTKTNNEKKTHNEKFK